MASIAFSEIVGVTKSQAEADLASLEAEWRKRSRISTLGDLMKALVQ